MESSYLQKQTSANSKVYARKSNDKNDRKVGFYKLVERKICPITMMCFDFCRWDNLTGIKWNQSSNAVLCLITIFN